MARKRRGLTPEDLDLWEKVKARTSPLHPARPALTASTPPAEPKTPSPHSQSTPGVPIPAFRIGQVTQGTRAHDLSPGLTDRISAAPLQMDRKRFVQMSRGKIAPEARIDLHGLTMAEAQPRLTGFILRAHANGARLVLVITGKGRDRDDDGPIPVRRGALRHQLPHWLSMPPLRPLVLQVSEAHLKHGGSGAFYVYLRRNP
jgi:DNA-nicking Smr family endonuclease